MSPLVVNWPVFTIYKVNVDSSKTAKIINVILLIRITLTLRRRHAEYSPLHYVQTAVYIINYSPVRD